MFRRSYADVFNGDERWQGLQRRRGQPLRVGREFDLRPQADVPRRHDDGRRRRCETSPARACSRCSATA